MKVGDLVQSTDFTLIEERLDINGIVLFSERMDPIMIEVLTLVTTTIATPVYGLTVNGMGLVDRFVPSTAYSYELIKRGQ